MPGHFQQRAIPFIAVFFLLDCYGIVNGGYGDGCFVPNVANGYWTRRKDASIVVAGGAFVASGSNLDLRCNSNFNVDLSGNATPSITCRDGEWSSDNFGQCTRPVTTTPSDTGNEQRDCVVPDLANGYFVRFRDRSVRVESGDPVGYLSTLVLVCNGNYVATTFSIKCSFNGQWNATDAACRTTTTTSTTSTTTTKTTTTTTTTTTRTPTGGGSSASTPPLACGQTYSGRIIGGGPAEQGSWPWIAQMNFSFVGESSKSRCGGSLIAPQWILTAAHCLTSPFSGRRDNVDRAEIWLGKSNLRQRERGQVYRYSIEIIAHPQFKNTSNFLENDFALVKLNSPVVTDFASSLAIRLVCLPDESMCDRTVNPRLDKVDTCHNAATAGWGTTDDGLLSPQLKQLDTLEIVSPNDCQDLLAGAINGNSIKDSQICAMVPDRDQQDACQGDSGGPFTCKNSSTKTHYLTGVVSFGAGCGVINSPGVYSRVCKVLPWIKAQIGR